MGQVGIRQRLLGITAAGACRFPTDDGGTAYRITLTRREQAGLVKHGEAYGTGPAQHGDDSVAGNQKGDGVGIQRTADGPGRAGMADGRANLRIGRHAAEGQAQQSFPDLDLEVGAGDVQIERARLPPGIATEDPVDDLGGLFRGMHEFCRRQAFRQTVDGFVAGFIKEGQAADAAFGQADQRRAKGGRMNAMADGQPFSSPFRRATSSGEEKG